MSLITKNVPALRPDHRSFVVVNGVLALVLLGVLLSSPDVTTVKWLTAGTLVYFALNSALLFLLAREKQKVRAEGDYDRRRRAAESVNGNWWQAILVKGDNGEIFIEGLTIVNIRLLVDVGAYELDGELFDEAGKSRATWRAEAVAFKTLTPVELFYRFVGYSFRGPVLSDPTGDVTGIGVFTFEFNPNGQASERAEGWFATGYVEKLTFGRRRNVRLVRVSNTDQEILDGKGFNDEAPEREQLIAGRYATLAKRYATGIGTR